MKNIDLAFEIINDNKFEVSKNTFEGIKVQLHINTTYAFKSAKLAAIPDWIKANEELPQKECDVRLYNIREKRYSFAKFKDGYFEISYICGTPVCINQKEYDFIYWCELPIFNNL